MVVALFALAVAMLIGGLTAVVQGYDIVLLERGWTLVIAGSVCATGGALLAKTEDFLSRVKNPLLEKPFDVPLVRRTLERLVAADPD